MALQNIDKDGDTFLCRDVMNSSPTPDNSGKGMYFLFIQILVHLFLRK